MKKALVLGAGGFIGGHLVKKFKNDGHFVRVVDLKYPDFTKSPADKYLLEDREFFRMLNRNGVKLYSPIPGVSTHVHEPYMSPGVDWKTINQG
jgi:nucleoside-diphosphate-sugar epimerase